MAEDAKVAEKRRLAEALRANLRRRKSAAAKAAQVAREASAPRSARDIADNQG